MDHQPPASTSGVDDTHGGWVADPARQPHLLDAWIEHVEARHQADTSAAALAPAPPDLEALMQAWTPEMQAHIAASPLPDPRNAACDLPAFARMCCGVLDVPAGGGQAGLLQGLHALFALYLEFKSNPAFQHCGAFVGAAAGGNSGGGSAGGTA